jgi:2-oxo-3-hexenedioate decarboxylase/2-keto-4-pentenoate hydratase
MDNDPLTQIVDQAWAAANDPPQPIDAGTLSVDEAQTAQARVLARWQAQGEVIGGWKLGLTSGRSRDAFGPDIRPFGFILKSRVHRSNDHIQAATIGRGVVENEVCFRMGRPLDGHATRDAALAAVDGAAPAFEVNQRRIADGSEPAARVADNLSNWGLVVGEFQPTPTELDSLVVTLTHDGTEVDRVSTEGHIDDHFESIARLARRLAQYGLALSAGDYVITGAFTRAPLTAGRFTGHFNAGLGAVSVNIQ